MRSVTRIKRTVEIARKRGEITIEESDDELAFIIFGIYLTEIRWWLGSGNLDVELGLARLRHALSIFFVKDEPPGRTFRRIFVRFN